MRQIRSVSSSALALLLGATSAFADATTNGPFGINVPNIGLNGTGIDIGAIDTHRPGDPDFDTNGALFHTSVNPTQVYWRDAGFPTTFDATADASAEVMNHPIEVAGIMISTDANLAGVAPGANLFSIGDDGPGPNNDPHVAESLQYLIGETFTDIRVINMSVLFPPFNFQPLDGGALLTQFVDWSASANDKDILYIVSGNQGQFQPNHVPTDNFNGMTIASSEKVGATWSKVGSNNDFSNDAVGDRTSISLLAPGSGYNVANGGNAVVQPPGPRFTSYAAPQVSGAAALLQQYAEQQFDAAAPRWDADARRHEVMKAVLMNSADKLIDNGTLAPQDGLLGMSRTVTDQNDDNWLASEAYLDGVQDGGGLIPLDDQMGAGHLNATRAVQQFAPGEFDPGSGDVPTIGWDYDTTAVGLTQFNKYPLAGTLTQDHFISITLAWDRHVTLMSDGGTSGEYDIGDTFKASTSTFPDSDNDDLINNLDLFLVEKGSGTLSGAVAQSNALEGTVQHIFFQLPETGEYEIWVRQFDADISATENYALAWWYGLAPPLLVAGDYSGNGTVGSEDYAVWRTNFGGNVTPGTGADGNGNGVIDSGDYVVWRNNLGSGTGSGAAIPEPTAGMLLLIGCTLLAWYRSRP